VIEGGLGIEGLGIQGLGIEGSVHVSLVIAVAQRKGGVGKTTLAVCLAAELDRRLGEVGLIDADTQGSACQWAEPGNLSFPVYELDAETRPVAEWARTMAEIPHRILVVDCAPNDRSLGAALALANLVVLPCMPSGLDIEATARTLAIVRRVRSSRAKPLRALIVPNRIDRRTLEGQQLADELVEFGEQVAQPIGDRSAFVRAFASGHSVAESVPNSLADLEIRALADQVVMTCGLQVRQRAPLA
jgi:chromosome partitioning protein